MFGWPMLDEVSMIKRIDQSDMLGCIDAFPRHVQETIELMKAVQIFKLIKVDNVLISGMGGSGGMGLPPDMY